MEEKKNNGFLKIFKSVLIAYGITLIFILIYALLLSYTGVPESSIPTISTVICILSILISSTLYTKNVKEKGLLNGAIIGLVYILLIYILSGISSGFKMSGYSFLTITFSILAGMIGGIVGVNLSK